MGSKKRKHSEIVSNGEDELMPIPKRSRLDEWLECENDANCICFDHAHGSSSLDCYDRDGNIVVDAGLAWDYTCDTEVPSLETIGFVEQCDDDSDEVYDFLEMCLPVASPHANAPSFIPLEVLFDCNVVFHCEDCFRMVNIEDGEDGEFNHCSSCLKKMVKDWISQE